jgi:hypothetical protein
MRAQSGAVPRTPGRYCAISFACIAFGLALRAATFTSGMFSDDFVETAMLDGSYPAPRGMFDVFDFTNGSAHDRAALMNYGALPWWTVPGLRLAMLRPLPSALVWLDRAWFGSNAVLCHVHSALWWVLAVVAVAALYAHVLTARVAALALLVFALEEGHTLPLAWLANRGALIAMCLAISALVLHVRAREGGGRMWPSALLAAVALGAGEWAFPFLGYLVAYECAAAPGSARERVRALSPALAVGAAYLLARRALGYGTLRSGVYIDPLREPLQLIGAAAHRIPVFCADLVFGVPAMWWDFGSPWSRRLFALGVLSSAQWEALPSWRTWQFVFGVVALAAVAYGSWSGMRAERGSEPRRLAFLLLGALLALVPVVSSFPSSRLVLPAAIGVAAWVAALIDALARHAWRLRTRRRAHAALAALLAGALVYVHIVAAALTSHADVGSMARLYRSVRHSLLSAEFGAGDVRTQRVIQLSASEHTNAVFLPFVRHAFGLPMPRSFWTLSAAPSAHRVLRPAANQLELRPTDATLLQSDMEKLYRADAFPFHAGDIVTLDGMSVAILSVRGGKPDAVRFTFARALEDPQYVFVAATDQGIRRLRLPAIGAELALPAAKLPELGEQ